MDDIDHAVAAQVRAELARRKADHSEAAGALGISPGTFSRKVNGRIRFSLEDLFRLGWHLNVSPAEFLPETTDASSRAA